MARRKKVEEPEVAEHLRGLDWLNPADHEGRSVTIVGAGGIGSFTTIALAKMFGRKGPSITVIDFDIVEPHNIPNQMFAEAQIGRYKAEAIAALGTVFGGADVHAVQGRVQDAEEFLSDIIVTGLDNMETRHWVRDAVGMKPGTVRLIDGRLAGEFMSIHSLDTQSRLHMAYYDAELRYTDEDAETAPCTAQAIIDVGFVMGGHMANAVRRALTEEDPPHEVLHSLRTNDVDVFTTIPESLLLSPV